MTFPPSAGARRPGRSATTAVVTVFLLALPASAQPDGSRSSLALAEPAASDAASITFSGFQVFEDGRARLSVRMTGAPLVEASHAGKRAEYLLRGVSIPVRNNANPLLTSHFASVVTSVRFMAEPPPKGRARGKKEVGRDTRLVVEMREAVKPAHRMTKDADGATLLVVDFPKPSAPPSQSRAPD